MIGDYKIGKVIGEGAFSKVKLGVHNQTGKKVTTRSLVNSQGCDKNHQQENDAGI